MIIRPVTMDDLDAVLEMGHAMHKESEFRELEYSGDKVIDRVINIISDDKALGMVADQDGHIVGMFGAFIAEYDYGTSLIARDMLVYIRPELRGGTTFMRFVKAYVVWAIKQNASQIYLGTSAGINQDRTAELYERVGFEKCGNIFKQEVAHA